MKKLLIHQSGFTRTGLSATVTRVSNFVEENVFIFLHRQGSPSRMYSVTHCPTGQICQSQCTQLFKALTKIRFTLSHVGGLISASIKSFFLIT